MFESVYVCKSTFDHNFIVVVPADIGIVKLKGCLFFAAAEKGTHGRRYGGKDGYGTPHKSYVSITNSRCEQVYSSVPAKGEAWLVEEGRKYINWTRVDHNLHLLNADGSIVEK